MCKTAPVCLSSSTPDTSLFISDLVFAIDQYLESQHPDMRDTFPREEKKKYIRMVFFTGDEADTLNQQLEEAIEAIEQKVRPHLQQKTYKFFPTKKRKA